MPKTSKPKVQQVKPNLTEEKTVGVSSKQRQTLLKHLEKRYGWAIILVFAISTVLALGLIFKDVTQQILPGFADDETQSYQSWIAGYEVSGQTGSLQNPSGDGISNIAKFRLGLDPTQAADGSVIIVATEDDESSPEEDSQPPTQNDNTDQPEQNPPVRENTDVVIPDAVNPTPDLALTNDTPDPNPENEDQDNQDDSDQDDKQDQTQDSTNNSETDNQPDNQVTVNNKEAYSEAEVVALLDQLMPIPSADGTSSMPPGFGSSDGSSYASTSNLNGANINGSDSNSSSSGNGIVVSQPAQAVRTGAGQDMLLLLAAGLSLSSGAYLLIKRYQKNPLAVSQGEF